MELSARQLEIVDIVRKHAPITGDAIAEMLGVSKPTIRSDLSVLVMIGVIDAKPKVGYFLGKASEAAGIARARMKEFKVKDIHGIPIIVQGTSTVHDAVLTLFLENVGSLIVADQSNILEGIVTRKDLLKVTLGNQAAASMPVHLVMTRFPNVVTVTPEEEVAEAARKMIRQEVDSLPVVEVLEDGRMKVIGRITKTHITRVFVEIASEE